MRRDITQKAMRVILASMLASDLTLSEIRTISEAFVRSDELGQEVGALLRTAVSKIEGYEKTKLTGLLQGDPSSSGQVLQQLMDAVKRKRLPKRDILSMIGMISKQQEELLASRPMTAEQMLRAFLDASPEHQRWELLDLIETGGRRGDPYLHGIMRDL